MDIPEIQLKSGTDKFVSIFGKSTVSKDSGEFALTQKVTEFFLRNNFGVIHGGYDGGIMQAVSDKANEIIEELGLPKERNIAVPQTQHDQAGWTRVSDAMFTTPATDIFNRLRGVTAYSAVAVVAPLGGDGTMLEFMTLWHENIISQYTKEAATPIIAMETPQGTRWRSIAQTLIEELDTSTENIADLEWLRFAKNSTDVEAILRQWKII